MVKFIFNASNNVDNKAVICQEQIMPGVVETVYDKEMNSSPPIFMHTAMHIPMQLDKAVNE